MVARPHAVRHARRRSVGDRSRARAGQGRACTRPRSRSWTCTSSRPTVPRRTSPAGFTDQVSDPVWSPDGTALYFRAVDNKTYDETIYRYTVADQKLEPVVRGEESFSRLQPTAGGVVVSIEAATRPDRSLAWSAAGGQRTRITNLNPQLARFSVQQAGAVLLRQRRRRPARRAALQAGRPRRRTTRCRSSRGSTRR